MKSSDTTQNSPGNSKENVQTRSQDNPLGYEKESKLLVGFAIPCIISMLVTALYNIVDQIFIGQGVGMLGNAATNIAFPLSTTCTAISLLLGIGSATNFSLHLGAGEKDESAKYAGNGMCLMAVFGISLFLLTTIFLTPMLKFFGATTDVLPYAEAYTRITAIGFPFLIANTGMSKLILADGSPRYSMISMLIGAVVNTILDPVFFLSRNEWLERIPNKREINEPYIFAYFLGAKQEYRNEVKKLAHDKGMKVVALRHMDQYVEEDENFGDFAPYDVSPERFLNLLRNAEYVCTDSFHGTAFSILNEKQFVVFNRYAENSSFSKNSRIDTLCVNFGLESRRYKNGMDLSDVVKDDIDYKAVGEKYKNLKQVTDQYLNTVLKEIRKRV